ncbi:hypothetical protein [Halorussus ruber]|uniref:hypothetical protein n=1 Tax=Halorussus ruber TaxID=1126238 RepID=UPI0010924B0C|nr:hypothetical protein [Halorussus ruber]
MARDETAHRTEAKESLLDRRSYLKLAGASAAAVAGFGTSSAAAQDGGVILEEDFASSEYSDWFTSAWKQGEYDQLTDQTSRTGDSCLNVNLPEGSHYGMDTTLDLKDGGLLSENPRELYSSYWVKFGNDFDFGGDTFSCKLPGFENHERRPSWDGASDGTNGWAARGEYVNESDGIGIGYYCYHMDMSGNYGDDLRATTISRGEWHHIEQYMKLNTTSGGSANRDGQLTMWVDGNRQFHDDSMAFTLYPENGINYAFQVYYGGGDPSPSDNDIYIDNWKMATSRQTSDQSGKKLELVSNDGTEAVEYEFTVEGNVSKDTYSGSMAAEDNDTITSNGDGTTTVSGVSGNGHGDTFWVDGPIKSMTIDESKWTIRYDGKEVQVSDIVESSGPAIDRFDVTKSEQLGDDRMFSVRWAVSGTDNGLETVEVVAAEGTDINFSVNDASGDSASGWDLFQFPVGTSLEVNLRVEDTAGNTTKQTQSITL